MVSLNVSKEKGNTPDDYLPVAFLYNCELCRFTKKKFECSLLAEHCHKHSMVSLTCTSNCSDKSEIGAMRRELEPS